MEFPRLLKHNTTGVVVLAKNEYECVVLTKSKRYIVGETIPLLIRNYMDFNDVLKLSNYGSL